MAMLFRLLITFFLFLLFSCRPFVKIFEDIEEAMYFKSSNIIESEFHDSLKVMTWNIRFGAGRIPYVGDSCGERSLMTEQETIEYLDKIINYINTSQPDILLLQEVDLSSKRTDYINQVQYILEETYFNYASYASGMDVAFAPKDGTGKLDFGNAIFSRWNISDAQRIKLALRTDQPSYVQYFYLRRNILKVKIQLPNNQDIYAVNIHASAFATDNTKEKQMATYKEVLDNLDNSGEYFVTGGDFNSLAPNANIIDFCEVDRCEGEIVHNDLDGGPHLEGSYFNNFDGESDLLTPFYNSYFPAIDLSLINNFEHLTHSTWNTNYNTLESESWSRKLDYLFTNIQNWTSTGNTDNSILEISDHAPVTANIYFNEK